MLKNEYKNINFNKKHVKTRISQIQNLFTFANPNDKTNQ